MKRKRPMRVQREYIAAQKRKGSVLLFQVHVDGSNPNPPNKFATETEQTKPPPKNDRTTIINKITCFKHWSLFMKKKKKKKNIPHHDLRHMQMTKTQISLRTRAT